MEDEVPEEVVVAEEEDEAGDSSVITSFQKQLKSVWLSSMIKSYFLLYIKYLSYLKSLRNPS